MRSRTVVFLWLCCALLSLPALAQEKLTDRTFKLSAGAKPPPATIGAMAWLAGHWTGQAFGGVSEEIWSPPKSGSMMGMYRMLRDGKPVFYELLTIVEDKGTLILRLKHFNADLTGWEEKGKTVDFPLVALGNGAVHFEGMSFHPKGSESLTIHLAVSGKDGSVSEETFLYSRVAPETR